MWRKNSEENLFELKRLFTEDRQNLCDKAFLITEYLEKMRTQFLCVTCLERVKENEDFSVTSSELFQGYSNLLSLFWKMTKQHDFEYAVNHLEAILRKIDFILEREKRFLNGFRGAVMKRHKALDMSGLFNHKLIYKELPKSGEYGLDNICILKEDFKLDGERLIDGVRFNFCVGEQTDNMICSGQSLAVNEAADKLYFAGFAYWGDSCEKFEIVYEDGETENAEIALLDWSHGMQEGIRMRFFTRSGSLKTAGICISSGRLIHLVYFHRFEYIVKKGKKIREIIFPDNMFMHIFATTIETNGED
ncbi:MAG: hypothetical protein ACLR06_04060 [Christensenellaceae bacterium]